jgi:hypothetical protein
LAFWLYNTILREQNMQVANYKLKYARTALNKNVVVKRDNINSTHKWVEYSLDIRDMQKLLISTKNLNEKYALMDALEVAERKKVWHYRQDNFNLARASQLLQAVISAQDKLK